MDGPDSQEALLDILQNLVANTRLPKSATARFAQASACHSGSGLHPAAPEDRRLEMAACLWLTQAGPQWTLCWQSGASAQHCLITRASDLSAWMVVYWTTMAVTGDGESGFDSGEGA